MFERWENVPARLAKFSVENISLSPLLLFFLYCIGEVLGVSLGENSLWATADVGVGPCNGTFFFPAIQTGSIFSFLDP